MAEKTGRNDPCPCGSGKKYKQCCLKNQKPLGKRRFKATVLNPKAMQASKEAAPDLVVEDEGPDLIARVHPVADDEAERL